jgi:GxxExxY protein
MHTNDTNVGNGKKLIYPELSCLITGICFDIHNTLGRYCREKQYGDALAEKLGKLEISYKREFGIEETGNVVDFLIDDTIVVELKAKPIILKDDYYQAQRYLQALNKKLALIINFRNRYLKPIRIIKIDTAARNKFN